MNNTYAVHRDDFPGSLADADVRRRRLEMLNQPHVKPLVDYVRETSRRASAYVPNFDPLDGGTAARVLFLFGAPGPGTFPPRGSGFVSRNNSDPSGRATWTLMQKAGVPRKDTVSWNTVAWSTGDKSGKAANIAAAGELRKLLPLLPDLRAVVLVGNFARDFGGPIVKQTELKIFHTVQTGSQAEHGPDSRDRWLKIPEIWRKAWELTA